MTEQTAVLRQDPPLLSPPACSPDRAHRVPGDRTAIPGLHDPVASARVVVEVECGILAHPPQEAGEPWRAVFTENGRRRFRQAMTEAELAAKLAKVTERLRACAPDMERPGARPDRALPGPRPAPGRQAVVPRHARHPAAAAPAVRRPGHRRGHLPGHHHRSHAADRQRRADRQRGRAAAQVPVGHGDRGHQGRVPD